MAQLKSTSITGNLAVTGQTVTASIKIPNQSGFIKADGSIDNTQYTTAAGHTHNYLPLGGGTLEGPLKFTESSLPKKNLRFLTGISPFTDGGDIGYCDVVTSPNAVGTLKWTQNDKSSSRIPTVNLLAYWNGAYGDTDT